MSDNKRYRPVFFRKVRGSSLFLCPNEHAFHPVLIFNSSPTYVQEDLDNSLHRTSRDQQKPNPAVRFGDTQVVHYMLPYFSKEIDLKI